MRNHRYCRIFQPVLSEADRRAQVLASFHILTTETLFLFSIALCYDIENPNDDGSCGAFVTEDSCLSRKSLADDTSAYCAWEPSDNLCSFAEPSFSLQVCPIRCLYQTAIDSEPGLFIIVCSCVHRFIFVDHSFGSINCGHSGNHFGYPSDFPL